MLLFLLSLIFNPLGLVLRWLPALYLAAWPIIIQTLGRDALILQAILLVLFILTCDITRELSLKLVGFDLISLPAGIFLIASLLSDKGSDILAVIIPVCSTFLVAIEPVFLIVESLIIMEMLKAFNKWIAKLSNIRDETSHDLSTWDPPLSRGSVAMRFVVILITIVSYIVSYMLIQESKILLGADDQAVPLQFKHAIALMVTLQLVALTATMYNEEGILSESAMVATTATAPIFIASWSFYHLKNGAYTR